MLMYFLFLLVQDSRKESSSTAATMKTKPI